MAASRARKKKEAQQRLRKLAGKRGSKTAAKKLRHVQQAQKTEWKDRYITPPAFVQAVHATWRLSFDAASDGVNVVLPGIGWAEKPANWAPGFPLPSWATPKHVWVNPPYSQCDQFVRHALNETAVCQGVVMLLPRYFWKRRAKWWDFVDTNASGVYKVDTNIVFWRRRPNGQVLPEPTSAPFTSYIVLFSQRAGPVQRTGIICLADTLQQGRVVFTSAHAQRVPCSQPRKAYSEPSKKELVYVLYTRGGTNFWYRAVVLRRQGRTMFVQYERSCRCVVDMDKDVWKPYVPGGPLRVEHHAIAS